MEFSNKNKKFLRQILYYFCRYISEKNIINNKQLAGFSFDAVFNYINIFGIYEFNELSLAKKFILQNVQKPNLALDLGANIGNHTVNLFSDLFNEVHCYEPNEKIYNLLKINCNELSNVKLKNFGISDVNETAVLEHFHTNLGASRVSEKTSINLDIDKKNFSKIELKKLDDIYKNESKKIDLIKLDIEGYELKALKGGERIIKEHLPIIIFEENNINKEGGSKVINYLKDLNYEFYTLDENFDFGQGKIFKLIKFFLQDIFGTKIKLKKKKIFKNKFYHLIFAKNINYQN